MILWSPKKKKILFILSVFLCYTKGLYKNSNHLKKAVWNFYFYFLTKLNRLADVLLSWDLLNQLIQWMHKSVYILQSICRETVSQTLSLWFSSLFIFFLIYRKLWLKKKFFEKKKNSILPERSWLKSEKLVIKTKVPKMGILHHHSKLGYTISLEFSLLVVRPPPPHLPLLLPPPNPMNNTDLKPASFYSYVLTSILFLFLFSCLSQPFTCLLIVDSNSHLDGAVIF